MPSTVPNVAKGRMNEFVHRVENGDPATARFVVVLLQDTGLETLEVLRDYDTLALLLAATNTEVTVASYARLVLAAADIAVPTIDDGADTQSFDTGDFDFGALEAGQSVQASVISYAPDSAGADSTFIPVQITRAAAAIPLNGEIFHFRTPNGLWSAGE